MKIKFLRHAAVEIVADGSIISIRLSPPPSVIALISSVACRISSTTMVRAFCPKRDMKRC